MTDQSLTALSFSEGASFEKQLLGGPQDGALPAFCPRLEVGTKQRLV